MSNLDDVIKDILGNMFYDRTKTISEQTYNKSKYIFEIDQVDNPQFSDEKIDQAARDRENNKDSRKDSFFGNTIQTGTTANSNGVPTTLRGIQPNLDLIISSTNLNRIKIDEFQNIYEPFNKSKAEKMFGEWCKALSTGNMMGKSGEDFWFDTSSSAFTECSASTQYYPRVLSNDTTKIDTQYGLKDIIPIYVEYEFETNFMTIDDVKKKEEESFLKMFTPKKTKREIEKEENEKIKKNLENFKKNANSSLAAKLKENPNWEPKKGWGQYKKGWDCFAGDCSKVGQIVKLPISKVTGKPTYKIFSNQKGQTNVCKPIDYNYCLEISWSLLNGNAQPNGMKKFTIPSRNPQRKDMGQVFIACSSNTKFENTIEKNTTLLYPWLIRYDGYCGTTDGENCTQISTEGEGGKVSTVENSCQTSYETIDVISSLDIRKQMHLVIPGNKINLGIGNYKDEFKEKFGTKGCAKCGQIKTSCGYYDTDCKKIEMQKCLDECQKTGEGEELKDSQKIFNSGQIIVGKI